MTIIITKQGLADCSTVEPVDRLLVKTSDGGLLYLAPARDPISSRIWYPVVMPPTQLSQLDWLTRGCKVTACGPVGVEMISLPLAGAAIRLRISHQRHDSQPSVHELKSITISELVPMTVHDLESLAYIP